MGFNEILLIKPKLDQSDANRMEDALNGRFDRVAKKFGKGLLKSLVGGGFIAAAFTAINRLLNPLEEVESRIKALLGQADSVTDSAEKFGTTAGKFFKLQQIAHTAGLDDAGLKDLLVKFQAAQDLAKKEIADPSQGIHRSTVAIKQFANEKDVADAFFRAIQDIKQLDKETRGQVEEAIFGEKLSGASKRFANTDFAKISSTIGVADSATLDQAFTKTENLSTLSRTLEAARNVQSFNANSASLKEDIIKAIDQIEKSKIPLEAQQLEAIQNLKDAAITINSIKGLVEGGLNQVEKLFGMLAPIAPLLNNISQGRGLRIGNFNLFGGKQ